MKLSHLSALAVAAVIGLSASAPAAHAGILGGLTDAARNVGSRVQNAQGLNQNQRVANNNSTSGAFGYLVPLRQCADRAYAYMGVTSPTQDQQTYINARCYAQVYGNH